MPIPKFLILTAFDGGGTVLLDPEFIVAVVDLPETKKTFDDGTIPARTRVDYGLPKSQTVVEDAIRPVFTSAVSLPCVLVRESARMIFEMIDG